MERVPDRRLIREGRPNTLLRRPLPPRRRAERIRPVSSSLFSIAVASMLAVQVVVSFAGLAAPVLAPLAAADFGVSPILVGVFVSGVYGTAAFTALVSGGFLARYGPVRVSQACLAFAAASLACAALAHPAALAAAVLLMGCAYGPATPASSALLASRTPPAWMNLIFSIRQTGVPLGNMLAGAVLPALALAAGWRAAVLAAGAACALLAFALQPLRAGFDRGRDPAQPFFARSFISGPLRLVFRDARLRRIAIASFAYSGMQVTLSTFLVTYLHERIGLSVVAAGLMLSAAQIAGALGRVGWGVVADRFVAPHLVLGLLGLAMGAFAIVVGLFTPAWPAAAILLACVAFGGTAVAWNGVFVAQVVRLAPAGRIGEATGGTAFLTFGGVLVAPIVFSTILALTGSYLAGFAAIAALTAALGLSFLTALAGARARP